jgi:hypothetical protein
MAATFRELGQAIDHGVVVRFVEMLPREAVGLCTNGVGFVVG